MSMITRKVAPALAAGCTVGRCALFAYALVLRYVASVPVCVRLSMGSRALAS